MSHLCLVADDPTGALDSAVVFCGKFGPIPVYERMPPGAGLPCVAIDTGTREADTHEARLTIERVVPELVQAQIAYKKIDSTLRGPWAAELACIMQTGAFSTCIFAPAFPQQGRITHLGRQLLRCADGSYSVLPVNPAELLENYGLKTRVVRCSRKSLLGMNAGAAEVLVLDASTVSDLGRIAEWGRSLMQRVLWCGSAGLARALAGCPPPSASRARMPLLALVGSNHEASRAQVVYALKQLPVDHVVIRESAVECIGSISTSLVSGKNCLVTFEFPPGFDKQQAAVSIREKLQLLLPAIHRPGTLLVTGGETLRSVTLAVSASHLEVDSEFAAGVPHATLRGGHWDGVGTVSKSGSFGSRSWLADFLAMDERNFYQDSGR